MVWGRVSEHGFGRDGRAVSPGIKYLTVCITYAIYFRSKLFLEINISMPITVTCRLPTARRDTSERNETENGSVGRFSRPRHSGSRGFIPVSPRVGPFRGAYCHWLHPSRFLVELIECPGRPSVVLTHSVHSVTLFFFSPLFFFSIDEVTRVEDPGPETILDQTFLQFLYVVRDACSRRPTSAKEGF